MPTGKLSPAFASKTGISDEAEFISGPLEGPPSQLSSNNPATMNSIKRAAAAKFLYTDSKAAWGRYT